MSPRDLPSLSAIANRVPPLPGQPWLRSSPCFLMLRFGFTSRACNLSPLPGCSMYEFGPGSSPATGFRRSKVLAFLFGTTRTFFTESPPVEPDQSGSAFHGFSAALRCCFTGSGDRRWVPPQCSTVLGWLLLQVHDVDPLDLVVTGSAHGNLEMGVFTPVAWVRTDRILMFDVVGKGWVWYAQSEKTFGMGQGCIISRRLIDGTIRLSIV